MVRKRLIKSWYGLNNSCMSNSIPIVFTRIERFSANDKIPIGACLGSTEIFLVNSQL